MNLPVVAGISGVNSLWCRRLLPLSPKHESLIILSEEFASFLGIQVCTDVEPSLRSARSHAAAIHTLQDPSLEITRSGGVH